MIKNGLRELVAHRVDDDIRQSVWNVRRTFTWDGHKIRACVHNDPYDFQCDYYVEVFSPSTLAWNRVYTASNTDWAKAVGALGLNRMQPPAKLALERLIDHLVSVAQDLLEGVPA